MDLKPDKLEKDDYNNAAKLHSEYISQGFLSTLGIPFLSLLYEAIDKDSKSILLIEKIDKEVVGFVAGTNGLGHIYKQLLFQPYRLFISLKPCLTSPKKIFRILEIFFMTIGKKKIDDVPNEELLSIVVHPKHQGGGYAEKLFEELCNYFKQMGVKSFKIIVGADLVRAKAFYTKLGSIAAKEIQVHKGVNSIIYVKEVD